MKFGKLLERVTNELPELNDMFLRYKVLKKQLKQLPASKADQAAEDGSKASSESHQNSALSPEEWKFISTLNEDVNKFNQFFIEHEEESVIKLHAMTEQLQQAASEEELTQLKSQLVDFHGSCVLLLHWSLLNYAAVAKILKKHDKLSGVLLRAPYLANVLQQPFNSTSIMSRLVKQAEELVSKALKGEFKVQRRKPATGRQEISSDEECSSLTGMPAPAEEAPIFRRTKLALETWETLFKTASTPSTIISQPMQHVQQLDDPAKDPSAGVKRANPDGDSLEPSKAARQA